MDHRVEHRLVELKRHVAVGDMLALADDIERQLGHLPHFLFEGHALHDLADAALHLRIVALTDSHEGHSRQKQGERQQCVFYLHRSKNSYWVCIFS